jgi:hypothetical protein
MNEGAPIQSPLRTGARESLDGVGAGDHDCPFEFGRRPRADAPFPFSTHQFARLLVLRGLIQESAAHGAMVAR